MASTLTLTATRLINRFTPLPMWVVVLLLMLFVFLANRASAAQDPAAYRVVYGCSLRAETDTINNQAAVVYYECKSDSSHVSFMLLADTPGAQRMGELTGQTFDVLLYRVHPAPAPVGETREDY